MDSTGQIFCYSRHDTSHFGLQLVLYDQLIIMSFYCFLVLYMKALIFDMDGVLVDAMPFHYEAMKTAVKEITNFQY